MSEQLVRLLHAAYAAPADGVSDADLLARVAGGRDDAAFELLVRRHADLVWKTARAVAGDHHAAEDAFQAAFLALAVKAKAVRGSVPGWLYRVAYHAALKAKLRARRAACVSGPVLPPASDPPDPDDLAAVHAELARLPDKYREPLVLCYLEGFTQAEAARRLGLPAGTVATRVSRGGDLLRGRLVRRGVGLSVPALAAGPAAAADLVSATLRLVASGGRPEAILSLVHGALSAMSSAKPKLVAGMLALAVGAGGVGVVAQGPGVAGGQGGGPPLAPGIPQKAAPPAGVAGGPPGGVGSPVGGEGAGGPGIGLGLPGGGPGGVAGMMGGPPQPEKLSVATADRVADPRQRARSQNNIKQILLAMHNHHDAYGFFPTGVKDEQGQLVLSWRVQLLPFIGQENLYKQFKLDEPWDSPANKPLAARMPDIYRAGVEKEAGHTYYQTFSGLGTVCDNSRPIRMADITDGTSNTIAVTEAGPPVPWTKPADLAYSPRKALPAVELPFRNVWHVGMGDGSVRAISPNPDPVVLRAAITRDGGEVYNMDALAAKPSVLDPEERKHVKLLLDELAVLRKQKTELAEQALAMREELMAAKKDAKVAGGPDFQALEEEKGRLLAEVEKLRAELVALRDALTAVKKQ